MLLTVPRHEVPHLPKTDQWLYQLTRWRDAHPGDNDRITASLAFGALILATLIEKAVRLLFSLTPNHSIELEMFALKHNFSVETLSPALIQHQIASHPERLQDYLYKAFETGQYELGKQLIEKGADPHKRTDRGLTPALLAHLLGYPKLKNLAPLKTYEEDYIALKTLSQWYKLHGKTTLHGQKLRLKGTIPNWMFASLAEALGAFQEWEHASKLHIGLDSLQLIQDALTFAYEEHDYKKIANRISNNEITFIGTGWNKHGICLAFDEDYMAIGNRGENTEGTPTLSVYKIDPMLVTPSLIEEILTQKQNSATAGGRYFYQTLLAKLSKTNRPEQDDYCRRFETVAPKPTKGGNCALASKKTVLRYAWLRLLEKKGELKFLKRGKEETKLFTNWVASEYFIKKFHPSQFSDIDQDKEIQIPTYIAAQRKRTKFYHYRQILA